MFPWLTKLVTKDRSVPKLSLQRDCSDDFDPIDSDVETASKLLVRLDTFQDSEGLLVRSSLQRFTRMESGLFMWNLVRSNGSAVGGL